MRRRGRGGPFASAHRAALGRGQQFHAGARGHARDAGSARRNACSSPHGRPGMTDDVLRERVKNRTEAAKFDAVAISLHDFETGREFSLNGGRFFHAASTMKAAVLLAIYKLAEEGRLR